MVEDIATALRSATAQGMAQASEIARLQAEECEAKIDSVIATDQDTASAWACWVASARKILNRIERASPSPSFIESRIEAERVRMEEAVMATRLRNYNYLGVKIADHSDDKLCAYNQAVDDVIAAIKGVEVNGWTSEVIAVPALSNADIYP